MIKNIFIKILIFVTLASAGEISVAISESLVNDYLKSIGNHQISIGNSKNQSLWSINDARVKFLEGSAEFYANVIFQKEKTRIKKNINKNVYVEYNYDKNIIQLMIEDPIVKMERKEGIVGKFDLNTIYQKEGLKFQGPKPKVKTIKLKTIKGRIKIDMNIKRSLIYFEPGVVRVAIDLDYK